MGSAPARWWATAALGALLVCMLTARAAASPDQDTARAKELFRQGNALRNAGDCQRALEYFVQSRALLPSVPNILNAAYCLNALGRYDEALEDYEVLLTQYAGELTPDERAEIERIMSKMRDQVARVDITANVTGAALVVDGRPRGQLPLLSPVRVLPGQHRVTVSKDGYQSVSATVSVKASALATLNVQLEVLRISGQLRIDDPELAGAEIFVDGAPVGAAPWRGQLSPGRHWVVLRRGEAGTSPTSVVVVEGQVASPLLALQPLGPRLAISVDPFAAELSVDGVTLSGSRFEGRLPRGRHALVARAEGYHTLRKSIDVTDSGPRTLTLALRPDLDHPRWRSARTRIFVDGFASLLLAPSLGSGAEASCSSRVRCAGSAPALGGAVGVRGGYELPSRVSLQLYAGYLSISRGLERSFTAATTAGEFELEDRIRVAGPFVGAALGERMPFGEHWELHSALGAGVLLAGARDEISARARLDGRTARARVLGSGETLHSASPFVRPELELVARVGALRVGAGLGAFYFPLQQPDNSHGDTAVVESNRCGEAPVYCLPFQGVTRNERSFGRSFVVAPFLRAGTSF